MLNIGSLVIGAIALVLAVFAFIPLLGWANWVIIPFAVIGLALGFVQFLAPTLQFLLSLFVFHEPLKPAQLACFILIWASIAVFSFDMLRKMRAERMIEVA